MSALERTYPITGMTCSGCVAAVQYALAKHPSVQQAAVTLDPPEATVSLSSPVPPGELQALLPPKYRIGPVWGPKTPAVPVAQEETRSWLATYKPLLLVFAFIAGIAVLTSFADGRLDAMRAMRYFMAGFFLVFSFFKLLDLRGFANNYAMYDLLAIRVPSYGLVYPFIELVLGIAYLLNLWPMLTNAATLVVMGFSLIGVLRAVLNKQKIQCACLGTGFNLPMSTVTVVEDLLMVVMAVVMVVMG